MTASKIIARLLQEENITVEEAIILLETLKPKEEKKEIKLPGWEPKPFQPYPFQPDPLTDRIKTNPYNPYKPTTPIDPMPWKFPPSYPIIGDYPFGTFVGSTDSTGGNLNFTDEPVIKHKYTYIPKQSCENVEIDFNIGKEGLKDLAEELKKDSL